jgi:hypothetical protein
LWDWRFGSQEPGQMQREFFDAHRKRYLKRGVWEMKCKSLAPQHAQISRRNRLTMKRDSAPAQERDSVKNSLFDGTGNQFLLQSSFICGISFQSENVGYDWDWHAL